MASTSPIRSSTVRRRSDFKTVGKISPHSSRNSEEVFIARLKYVLWRTVTILAFGTVYVAVVSEGFRVLVPTLGHRLYKLPFLAFLYNYEDTHRIDIAIVMAMFLMFGVLFLWERLLHQFVNQANAQRQTFDEFAKTSAENTFLLFAGVLTLGSDAILFYCAVNSLSWGSSAFSFTALVATVAYTSIILTIAHVTNKLHGAAFPMEEVQ